jgi:Zn-finger nucleic acid-binding protein
MKCPINQTTLVLSERSGIEIDYCPECRGVWLDRGELDKLIDKSAVAVETPTPSHGRSEHRSDASGAPQQHKKRRESFLGDLFDF